jgi:hypothetical protein
MLVIFFKRYFNGTSHIDVGSSLYMYCSPPFFGCVLVDRFFTHGSCDEQEYMTAIRDKPKDMMLHEVMTMPAVSGFWVTKGLKQTSLCTRKMYGCKTHMRQTERQWREQKKDLWTQMVSLLKLPFVTIKSAVTVSALCSDKILNNCL